MIFYFSGTGNSKWVAEHLAKATEDEVISIIDVMRFNEDISTKGRKDLLGLIFPIYAWETPCIMMDFIHDFLPQMITNMGIDNHVFTYAVATCGGEVGNAFEKLSNDIKLDSFYSVVMPDNYVMMFKMPQDQEIEQKLSDASIIIEDIAECILLKRPQILVHKGIGAGIKTGLIAKAFKLSVTDKPFNVLESCIECGLCKEKCPMDNIQIVDGKPIWLHNCIHCTACINYCPTEAIQYGNRTLKRGRYNLEGALERLDI